jgi:23S rRNA (adenine2503-C2)-methyltransferase
MEINPYFYDLDFMQLSEILQSWGEPAYRAQQVWRANYRNLVATPSEIPNIPKTLRNQINAYFKFSHLEPKTVLQSKDGETIKTLFRLPDNYAIEAVLMRYEERNTLCISTQSGCAMGCVFCATGQMGFRRNLSSGEIVEQVIYYARQLRQANQAITNVVLMGMGEPFHNYDACMNAIDRMNHPEGLGLGARRFTISTVGLVPMIKRFANEHRQINLAISLHATDNETREHLLPINKKYPLEELLKSCREYVDKTHRRITFEWALIQDVNDSIEQAHQLGRLLGGLLCHVNVIPLNPTRGYTGAATTQARANEFQKELERLGIPCTIRVRRGIDIHAGCGQLAVASSTGSLNKLPD